MVISQGHRGEKGTTLTIQPWEAEEMRSVGLHRNLVWQLHRC
jgi:hypothetical protein